jgi:hypothetical protein
MEKTAYVSPPNAELYITIIRDANPRVVITLDVGLPNWLPHFELKLPLVEDDGPRFAAVIRDAVSALMDEVTRFMMTMKYDRDIQVQLYAAALACLAGMTVEDEADAAMPEYTRDNVVKTYEGRFPLPMSFINETQERVVTAATKVERVPATRRIELTKLPPQKTTPNDVERIIRMYKDRLKSMYVTIYEPKTVGLPKNAARPNDEAFKGFLDRAEQSAQKWQSGKEKPSEATNTVLMYKNRSIKMQPKPMWLVVYDQLGKPTGVIPAPKEWKSNLLKSSNMEERDAQLLSPLLGDNGKMYPQGYPVKIVKRLRNENRFIISDAGTGEQITEAHTNEVSQIAG